MLWRKARSKSPIGGGLAKLLKYGLMIQKLRCIQNVMIPIVDCFYYVRHDQEISDISLFIRLAKFSKVVVQGMINTAKIFRSGMLCENFLDNERKEFFDSFVMTNSYFVYAVIHEGIIRLDEGIKPNHDGLNFFVDPWQNQSGVYIS